MRRSAGFGPPARAKGTTTPACGGNSIEQKGQTRPSVAALRLADDERIVVDGRLEEAVWQRAMPATDFAQLEPENGAPATERTEVRVAFDRDRLYFGVQCFDSEPTRLAEPAVQRLLC